MAKQRSKKILVSVVTPLILRLNKQIDEACLHRDAYLDAVFAHEAEQLAKELPAANSEEAKTELARHLKLLDTKPVNFALSEETVQAINDVCTEFRVPRDCFINRVLLFLVVKSPQFFDLLLDIDVEWLWDWHEFQGVKNSGRFDPPYLLDGSLATIRDIIVSDPFGPIRACIEAANEDGVHCHSLHSKLLIEEFFPEQFKSALGFNCYLPDSLIKGSKAAKEEAEELLRLFDGIDKQLSETAANKPAKKRRQS